jgi:hypothetical protein
VKRALLLFAVLAVPASNAARLGGAPVALVTAETQNQLIAVELPSGRIMRRLPMPADPQNVEADNNAAVVVGTRGAAATIVDVRRLRIRRVIHGFGSPHIAALSPGGRYAYVTDDARGQLVVINLARATVVRRVFVGLGAHHMAVRPDGQQLWIALGERARSIVICDTSNAARPRVIGHLTPDGAAHDLAFGPDGERVWVTHDDRSTVSLYDAYTRRRVLTFASGPPPQHVVFSQFELLKGSGRQHLAYVTSGYGGSIQVLWAESHRLVRTVRVPYGSFNASSSGGLFATASLLRGTLTELDAARPWRRLGGARVAPAARDVALVVL